MDIVWFYYIQISSQIMLKPTGIFKIAVFTVCLYRRVRGSMIKDSVYITQLSII